MKHIVFAAVLLGAAPVLADEKAKLVEMCEISWAAYNNQDINLLRSFLNRSLR